MQHSPEPRDAEILAQIDREEREYRGHWLWEKLGATPEQFHQAVIDAALRQGISPRAWNQALATFKEKIETRVREQKRNYVKTNLRLLNGMRA